MLYRSDEATCTSFLPTDQLSDVSAIPPLQRTAGESQGQVNVPFIHPLADKGTEQKGGLRTDQCIWLSLSFWANEKKLLNLEKRGGEKVGARGFILSAITNGTAYAIPFGYVYLLF